jgi:hypothetical protein
MKTAGFILVMQKTILHLKCFLAFYYFKLLSVQLSVCLFILSNQYVVKLQQICDTPSWKKMNDFVRLNDRLWMFLAIKLIAYRSSIVFCMRCRACVTRKPVNYRLIGRILSGRQDNGFSPIKLGEVILIDGTLNPGTLLYD